MEVRRVLLCSLLLATTATVPAHAQDSYSRCPTADGTLLTMQARSDCATAAAVAAEVTTTSNAPGWTPIRATPGTQSYDITLRQGNAVVRLRLAGDAPDIDGWSAGRELIFARRKLTPGGRVRGAAALCTSAFLVRWNHRTAGLSAAHCAGLKQDRTADLGNSALRRRPQPGIVLGRVLRVLTRTQPLDALLLPVPTAVNRPANPTIYRGDRRPPFVVKGIGKLTGGRRICFSGRTSGPDQCGTLAGRRARLAESYLSLATGVRVRCSNIRAREGDSGGPVYTAPRQDGSVYALGIVTLVFGPYGSMCFTPLAPVLDKLNATLVTG